MGLGQDLVTVLLLRPGLDVHRKTATYMICNGLPGFQCNTQASEQWHLVLGVLTWAKKIQAVAHVNIALLAIFLIAIKSHV
jgi:hypothetical protein